MTLRIYDEAEAAEPSDLQSVTQIAHMSVLIETSAHPAIPFHTPQTHAIQDEHANDRPDGTVVARMYAPVGEILSTQNGILVHLDAAFRRNSPEWMQHVAHAVDGINADIRQRIELLDRDGMPHVIEPPLDPEKMRALENTLRHASDGRLQIRKIAD